MFIIEGLVYYLPPEAFKKSLTGISETAVAGSRLFFDFLHLDALANEIVMPGLETLLVVSSCCCFSNSSVDLPVTGFSIRSALSLL
jgi:hypothetical protein